MQQLTPSKPPKLRRAVGWLVLSLLSCSLCWGQNVILHLHNGDRLTGRIVSESTNRVVLATAFSESVPISKDLIKSREEVPVAPRPLVPATGIAAELKGTNQAAAGTNIAKAVPQTSFGKFLAEWHGEGQLGANLGFSTIHRETFTGHLKLTENHKFPSAETSLKNILEYDFAYGKADNVLSDNRMEGRVTTEYDLTKRFLVYNAAVAGYDHIRNIDLQYDLGPGVGYKWVLLTNFVFKTEFGGDYQEQFFPEHKNTSRYSLRLEEDSWWQITPKIRWDQKFEFFPELDAISQYRLRFETNLSYLLRQNLTLSLNLIDQYDTALPAGTSNNDLQIRSLLGIKF